MANNEKHFVQGLAPIADAFAGTVNCDVAKGNCDAITILYYQGVGTTGTSTLTVDACDNVTPSNTTAVPFEYRINTATDVFGDWTAATTAGFTTTAGSAQVYELRVDPAELAEEGYEYFRLTATESANAAVLGGVMYILEGLRYGPQNVTTIT